MENQILSGIKKSATAGAGDTEDIKDKTQKIVDFYFQLCVCGACGG